jgi:hypothetical protein
MESEATVTALHESALQRLAEAVGAPPPVADAVIEPTYLPFTASDLSALRTDQRQDGGKGRRRAPALLPQQRSGICGVPS